ncbi:MAG: HEAT repeat domain-containing protein [Acidobacteriota bacterium]
MSTDRTDDQIQGLLRSLSEPDPRIRQTTVIRLGCIGAAAEQAVPELLRITEHDTHANRAWAAFALVRIGRGSDAFPILLSLLRDERPDVRSHAAIAISALGPSVPVEVLPDLVAFLDDPVENVRWAIVWTLGEVGAAATFALERLRLLKKDPSPPVRLAVASSIKKIHGI